MQHSAGTENKTLPKELFLKTLNYTWSENTLVFPFDLTFTPSMKPTGTLCLKKNSFIFNLN